MLCSLQTKLKKLGSMVINLPVIHRSLRTFWRLTMPKQEKPSYGKSVSTPRSSFDTFLCHNSEDKLEVQKIRRQLIRNGINPWLDEWNIRPGISWQRSLEDQIQRIPSAVVFVGRSGIGPWQLIELEALLHQFVRRGCPVIPVILPSTRKIPTLPIFLQGMMWVDFRKNIPNPIHLLMWGITGNENIKPN
jgi:hypothetical protein